MPRLSTSPNAWFLSSFYPVWKASTICWQAVLFRCGTTCCLLYQRASLRYQQGCTACFTEKQRDLSIPMQLQQSVCRPYLLKAAGQNQTTRFQIYPLLLFLPKMHNLLSARQYKSSTQPNTRSLASDSAIGLHHYDDSRFSILAQGYSPFRLSAPLSHFYWNF